MDNSRESNAARIDRDPPGIHHWADAETSGPGDQRPPRLGRRDVASLLAPAGLAVVYGLLVLVFGAGVLDTGRPWPGAGVAFALLGALFLAAALGTVRLVDDAGAVREAAGDWRPDARRYVAAGALVLLALQAARFAAAGRPVPDPVPVYAGTLVVALPCSSLVAGPIYLLQRYRHD